ncbi:MAG: D-alanine--D-alanine ligase [Bacilli bacterium]|nr:D-alanine--D-alanine ligase [Bacilli bacterium]
MKINVGVMYGGNSTEHEISIISAVQAMNNMDTDKYNIVPIYLSKDNVMYTGQELLKMDTYKDLKKLKSKVNEVLFLKKNNEFVLMKNKFPYITLEKIDIAFPIMHGYNTEDGSIAGYLEVLGIPFCESDIYASVIGQDKIFQKQVLSANGVSVVDYKYFYESDYQADSEAVLKDVMKLKFPVIVKPSRQGSSVGINIAKTKEELIEAIEEAINYDEKILVEKVISNLCELNCSVVGDNFGYEASLIEEVYGSDEILSYKDKYMSDSSKNSGPSKGMASTGRKIPADIPAKTKKAIEDMSIKACKALNTCGVVRIDYLMDRKTGDVYLNELNIIPGSLSFYLWAPKGVKYSELLTRIIECGIRKYQNKAKKLSSFETNVLASFNGSKGVKK